MINADALQGAFKAISETMAARRNYLIELDQRNGDGDLGISMSDGYAAAYKAVSESEEKDLGKLCVSAGKAFNEAAPSSLGTITSIFLMGMARHLKGNEEMDLVLLGEAMDAGLEKVMEKAGSKPGEKTILDAVCPAVAALRENADKDEKTAFGAAAKAAAKGAQATADMMAVHGRAAYFGEKSIGLVDGGAVAGKLVFEAIEGYLAGR